MSWRSAPRPVRIGAARWAVRGVLALVAGLLALLVAAPAANAVPSTWGEVADEMAVVLAQADTAYRAGDPKAAKDAVNEAYYGYYEKLGFEATVMSHISGERAAAVEYQFAGLLKDINAGAPPDQLGADIEALVSMLREDAVVLDGEEESNPYAVFVQALLIMLREGVEAILVLGAIIAYLVKTGNTDKTRIVYFGAGAALLASVALAWLLNTLTGLAGANQEIIEGVTILLAVAMLIYGRPTPASAPRRWSAPTARVPRRSPPRWLCSVSIADRPCSAPSGASTLCSSITTVVVTTPLASPAQGGQICRAGLLRLPLRTCT